MDTIDNFLNKITMYRLVLYYLIFLVSIAAIFTLIGTLPFSFINLLLSVCLILAVSILTNTVFAQTFNTPTNVESVYITAFILVLIVTPLRSVQDAILLGWISVLAVASKYILAINKKHIFNPAAIAVTISAFTLNYSASWWIGTLSMLPFVLAGGLLVVRKLRRFDLVLSFILVALIVILFSAFLQSRNIPSTFKTLIMESPLFFFAFIMLTEPLTTPPTKNLRYIYGGIVGFLFAPQIHIGSVFTTPEIALVLGNVYSYLVSPKEKLFLKLKEKIKIAPDIYDFIFFLPNKLSFTPGQYMEWTLGHKKADSRGNRRYFTIASSPTEDNLRIGVKVYENPSSFKKALTEFGGQSEIVASQLAGEFVLPKNQNEKLVFIAGGIGVTPFRSIIKYLIDTKQKRDTILFYSNKDASEIVYTDVLNQAQKELGIKTIYTLTDEENIPAGWQGKVGRINEKMIQEEVPDYNNRIFYLSGPHAMVTGFEKTLKNLGIRRSQIKTDFFPGFV